MAFFRGIVKLMDLGSERQVHESFVLFFKEVGQSGAYFLEMRHSTCALLGLLLAGLALPPARGS